MSLRASCGTPKKESNSFCLPFQSPPKQIKGNKAPSTKHEGKKHMHVSEEL